MRHLKFWIPLIYLLFIFFTKVSFNFNEHLWAYPIVWVETTLLLSGFIAICVDYFNDFSVSANTESQIDTWAILLLILTIIVCGGSLLINSRKHTVAYDAIALYDARAKYMLGGLNFRSMQSLVTFDDASPYYYWLYPPFTTYVHYYWYILGVPGPVAIFYGLNLLILAVYVFCACRQYLTINRSLLVSMLSVAAPSLFALSTMEYTNLPYSLVLVFVFFSLFDYFANHRKYNLWLGLIGLALSMWIRFLEPMWTVFLLSMFIVFLRTKDVRKYNFWWFIFGSVMVVVSYASWQYVLNFVVVLPKFLSTSSSSFVLPIFGLFNGRLLAVLAVVVESWWSYLLAYGLLFFFLLKLAGKSKGLKLFNPMVFSLGVLLVTILAYIVGIYFVSFQSIWWKDVANDSLLRSSSFLIPIATFLSALLL